MALCSSGSLSICATAGTNRSISTEVGTGSGSLSALSVSAGKSAPHGMLEFYGYDNTPTPLYLTSISSIPNTNCLSSISGGHGAGYYCLTIDWNLASLGKATTIACVVCNGLHKYCERTLGSGSFASFCVISTDCICFCTVATLILGGLEDFANTEMTIASITNVGSNYYIDTPCIQTSFAGIVP